MDQGQIELLRQLVEIPSDPSHPAGIEAVQDILARELEGMGFHCRRIPNPAGAQLSAHLLVAELAGQDPRFITLVGHADTVAGARGQKPEFAVLDSATLAQGPGVADDKGGLVVMLSGLRAFLQQGKPRMSLRVLSSPSEEQGSPGFTDLFSQFGKDSLMALGFEPALDDGSIIESRRGNRWYHVRVKGVEAHSGRAHKQGANAALELAHKLTRLSKLTHYRDDVTVSVGYIQGGRDAYNIVCGWAEAKVDTRFSNLKARDKLHKKITAILDKTHVRAVDSGIPTESTWQLVDDCPPFSASSGSRPFVREYLRIVSEIEGAKVRAQQSGGAADVCYMSRKDLVVMDGLGPIGGKLHAKTEFVQLRSLHTRSQALARFLSYADKKL